ncbi:uncharacterized protein LOC111334571 [Stylophora pistillata]|uniref:uncharacterized protein LOC111334571 n=1 Tax=Stylophora pistillata TaxID=50429 RepID=UPI000C0512EC|nr:uncharacterized protein LOC111334571 [Stylophora pistillata]
MGWCATCETASRQSKKPRIHDCRLNWESLSKTMEADVCVDLVKSVLKMQKRKYFKIMTKCSLNALTFYGTKFYFCGFTLLNICGEKNAAVSVLVRDDDSSTIGKVRKNVEHEVEKWSDVVHAKRSFGSSLYNIKIQNKSLTDMAIQYFQRCFGYALKQNKELEDEEGVRNGLNSIVPHAYGDHSSCGNWCGYLKNPASYKHRGLPHGKDLMDKSLRQSLEKIIEVSAVYMYGGFRPMRSTLTALLEATND